MFFWKKRVPAAHPERTRIDNIIRKMALATDAELDKALSFQKRKGGLTGNILVGMGVLTQKELVAVLDVQREMREGDAVSANLRIVSHHTEQMKRTTSQMRFKALTPTG